MLVSYWTAQEACGGCDAPHSVRVVSRMLWDADAAVVSRSERTRAWAARVGYTQHRHGNERSRMRVDGWDRGRNLGKSEGVRGPFAEGAVNVVLRSSARALTLGRVRGHAFVGGVAAGLWAAPE